MKFEEGGMKKVLGCALAVTLASAFATAQTVKSKKEMDAYQAIQTEQDPEQRIKKADEFIAKFGDTTLKSLVYDMAAEAAEQKGDAVKAMVYSQNALEADPKDFQAMLLISGELARGTRENDLDKEEKLGRSEKMANDALAAIKDAAKPNPKVSDEAWENFKKDQTAQGHVDLGMAALARKKVEVAISEFKLAVEGAATADPVPMVRLAAAYDQAGKPDEGLVVLAKVLAMPNLNPAVKQFAEGEKKRAEAAKNAKK